MKLNEKIEDIMALFENSDYIDDPGCDLGILLTALGPQNGVFVALPEKILIPNSAKNLRISSELFLQKNQAALPKGISV